ncbi:MAG: twin-arginine translocase TatA/TatE family subunit [Maricaulaceae bacterium]
MAPGPWQIAIVLVLIVLFFGGRGKISAIMGDMGKGITSFKKGLKEGAQDVKDAADDAIDVTPAKDDKSS